MGSRGRPEESRAAILQAAVREFSREGVAGARTDAIARPPRSTRRCSTTTLKTKTHCMAPCSIRCSGDCQYTAVRMCLDLDLPPRKKILAYVGAHFRLHRQSPALSPDRAGRDDARRPGRVSPVGAHREAIFPSSVRQSCRGNQEGQAEGEFRPGRSGYNISFDRLRSSSFISSTPRSCGW